MSEFDSQTDVIIEAVPPPQTSLPPPRTPRKVSELSPTPLRQEVRIGPLVGDEDYTRKYANDEYGAEMFPNARVWRTYIDERDIADKDYISDNNATLDGILVFASIFSAIVTTFVTQTYQSLVPDPHTASQGLLSELIAVQRGAANGSSVNAIPSYDSSSPTFKPETADVWLNSLWFISLMFSLLTAFLGVLAKQWLYQYVSVTSGTPRDRALVLQARNLGLYDWQVPALIGFLPIILHLSLALFLVGLIILLHSVLPNVAYFGIVLVGTVYAAYMISNLLPVIYPRCPYRTALTPKIYQLYHFLPSFPRLHVRLSFQKDARAFAWKLSQGLSWFRGLKLSVSLSHLTVKQAALWKDAERADALNTRGALEAKALSWLYSSSFNPTAQQVVLEAFAGLDRGLDQYAGHWDDDLIPQVLAQLQRECTRLGSTPTPTENTDRQLELYLRALIQIQPFCAPLFPMNSWNELALPEKVLTYLDRRGSTCDPRLEKMVHCGLYHWTTSPSLPTRSMLFSSKRSPDGQLSAAIWIGLIQKEVAHDKTIRSNMWPGWHVQYLKIIRLAGFFTNSVRNDSPSMTWQNPNASMCEAMFRSIIQYTGSEHSPTHVRTLLRFLSITMNLSREGYPDKIFDTVIVALDCILDSVREKRFIADAWSCIDTELFATLISYSAERRWNDLRTFQWRILWLLERCCIVQHPDLIPIPVLDAWTLPAMNVYLDDGMKGSEEDKTIYERVGLTLLCYVFDRRQEIAYDSVFSTQFLSHVRRHVVRGRQHFTPFTPSFTHTLPTLVEHFLGGIPTERERAIVPATTIDNRIEQLVNHIYQPDHLEALCYLLLPIVGPRVQAQEPSSLVRLLCLKPTHHVWSVVIVRLKHRIKPIQQHWPSANGWQDQRHDDGKRTEYFPVLEDVLAIQDILNIHAHNSVLDSESLAALAWDNGQKVSADNEILAAYRLTSENQALEDQARPLKMRWPDRLRSILPSRKSQVVPDVESESYKLS